MGKITQVIMRRPGVNSGHGLTTAQLGNVQIDTLVRQHEVYADMLAGMGIEVLVLPPLDTCPDAYFVEDTAVVTEEVAVITRPGALQRRDEAAEMEPVLASFRPIRRIEDPGTLDGGDVLIMGKTCYVGLSDRTNASGANQLTNFLSPFGYNSVHVPLSAGLHLKSSVNKVCPSTVLMAPDWANREEFRDYSKIVLDADEAYAANVLWINGHVIMPSDFPKTRKKLETLAIPVIELDMSEPRKMDGGLTCMSLRF